MGDQIKIQQAANPWTPTDDSVLKEVFLAYDFPRIGIIEQAGHDYLFAHLDDHKDLSMWAYGLIEPGDIDRLRAGPDAAVLFFEETRMSVSIAIAREGNGIVHSASYFPLAETFLESAFLCLDQSLSEARDFLAQAI